MSLRVRPARSTDARPIHELVGRIAAERIHIFRTEPPALAAIEAAIGGDGPYLVAVDGDMVVGQLGIRPAQLEGLRHVGALYMGVDREKRGQGIGRRLVEVGVQACEACGVWRIELEVFPTNQAAKRLYASMGFEEEGVAPRGRLLPGYVDAFHRMARLLASQPPKRGGPPVDAEVPLQDASGFVVDAVGPDDALVLHHMLKEVAGERRWISMLDSPGEDAVRTFHERGKDAGDPHLVARKGSEILGWIDISRIPRDGRRHAGNLGMGVDARYRGQGVGRKLLREAMDAARASGFLQVELGVWASNTPARTLYERAGFQETGWGRRARYLEDFEDDLVSMQLILDD